MAQTPWGDLIVADAHIHFFSHNFYTGLSQQKKLDSAQALAPILGWDIPASDPASLAGQWVTELDRFDVGRACLIGSSHGDEASVAAAVEAYPNRFFGFFMLDPTKPDAV